MSARGRADLHYVLETLCLVVLVVFAAVLQSTCHACVRCGEDVVLPDMGCGRPGCLFLGRCTRYPPAHTDHAAVLFVPAAVYLLALAVSTFFSIAPRVSAWGSYTRLQGFVAQTAYVLLFLVVAAVAQRAQVRRRIVAVVLAASVPVALYGILQRFGIDPLPWPGRTAERVASTLGGPIFLGGYMAMLVPLSIHGALLAWAQRTSWGGTRAAMAALACACIAGTQALAIFFSGSRGPAIGLLAGCTVYAFLTALCHPGRRTRNVLLGFVVAACVGVVGVLLWMGQGAPSWFGRFAHLIDPYHKTSRERLVLWNESARMLTTDAVMVTSDGERDPRHNLRWLFGYGPETARLVYPQRASRLMAQQQEQVGLADRAHNDTWDSFLSHGLIGLVSFIVLLQSILTLALRLMGFIGSRRDVLVLNGWAAGGAIAGAVGACASGYAGFVGVGIPFGLMAGCFVGLMQRVFRQSYAATWGLPTAILGAMVAHVVEIQFAFPTPNTRILFWTMAGLLAGAHTGPLAMKACTSSWVQAGVRWGILSALALSTLGFAFLLPDVAISPVVLLLSIAGGVAILAAGMIAEAPSVRTYRCAFLALLVAAGCSALFFAWPHLAWERLARAPDVLVAARTLERYLVGHMVFMGCGVAIIALSYSVRTGLCACVCMLASLPLVYRGSLPTALSGMAFLRAEELQVQGQLQHADAMYERALRWEPYEDQYWRRRANRLYKQATASRETGAQDFAIQAAIRLEQQAVACVPWKSDGLVNMGRMYRWWASVASNTPLRAERAERADTFFAKACQMEPMRPSFLCHRALLHVSVLDDAERALQYLTEAVRIAPKAARPRQLLGHCYARMAVEATHAEDATRFYERAMYQFEQSFANEREGDPNSYQAHLAAGELYAMAGQHEPAVEHLFTAVHLAPASMKKDLEVRARRIQMGLERRRPSEHTMAEGASP